MKKLIPFFIFLLLINQAYAISSALTPASITFEPEGSEDEGMFVVKNINQFIINISVSTDSPEIIKFEGDTDFQLSQSQKKEVRFKVIVPRQRETISRINVLFRDDEGSVGQSIVVRIIKYPKMSFWWWIVIGVVVILLILTALKANRKL